MGDRFDYSRAKATADRMIKRYGTTKPAYLLEPGATSGEDFNPTQGAPIQHKVEVVRLEYSTREIDGVRIIAGDRRYLIAVGSLNIEPTPAWQLQVDGVVFTIVPPLKTLAPGDVTIFWDAQCRTS